MKNILSITAAALILVGCGASRNAAEVVSAPSDPPPTAAPTTEAPTPTSPPATSPPATLPPVSSYEITIHSFDDLTLSETEFCVEALENNYARSHYDIPDGVQWCVDLWSAYYFIVETGGYAEVCPEFLTTPDSELYDIARGEGLSHADAIAFIDSFWFNC